MIWHVSYRRGDETGFRAVPGRSSAIRVACDYLDRGYHVVGIMTDDAMEHVPSHELSFNHSKRKATRLQ